VGAFTRAIGGAMLLSKEEKDLYKELYDNYILKQLCPLCGKKIEMKMYGGGHWCCPEHECIYGDHMFCETKEDMDNRMGYEGSLLTIVRKILSEELSRTRE